MLYKCFAREARAGKLCFEQFLMVSGLRNLLEVPKIEVSGLMGCWLAKFFMCYYFLVSKNYGQKSINLYFLILYLLVSKNSDKNDVILF